MLLEPITNRILPIGSVLQTSLSNCTNFSIASSFINQKAINFLEHVLSKNKLLKESRLLISVYGCFNREDDLKRLQNLAKKFALKFQVHISQNKSFHWKYYHFIETRKQSVYVGSANFTSGGMETNGELLVKLSDALPAKEKGFTRVLAPFEKEWKESGAITEFNLSEYKEQPRPNTEASKGSVGNKSFFETKKKNSLSEITSDKAFLTFLTADVTNKTEKMVTNLKPNWKAVSYFICTKKEFEQCCDIKKILILEREAKDVYYASWVQHFDELTLPTPDGKYFIAFELLSKIKKLSAKSIHLLKDKKNGWGFKLEGREGVLESKVLGKNQVKEMEQLLNLPVRDNKIEPEIIANLNLEFNSTVSFSVLQKQSIHNVVNDQKLVRKLPKGFCKMVFYDPRDYSLVFDTNPRTTGRTKNGQNIFSFFANTGSRSYPKWKQLQEEMIRRRIPSIMVKVFYDS